MYVLHFQTIVLDMRSCFMCITSNVVALVHHKDTVKPLFNELLGD
jgi:hypothetical protein